MLYLFVVIYIIRIFVMLIEINNVNDKRNKVLIIKIYDYESNRLRTTVY